MHEFAADAMHHEVGDRAENAENDQQREHAVGADVLPGLLQPEAEASLRADLDAMGFFDWALK